MDYIDDDDIWVEQNYPNFITNFSAKDIEKYKAAIVEYYAMTGNPEGLYIDDPVPPCCPPDGALFHENNCINLTVFWRIFNLLKE